MKSAPDAQPAREANINAIVSYFESGITPCKKALGIELEHIIVDATTNEPVSYSQDHGIEWLLEQLKPDYTDTICDAQGDILGLVRPEQAITLEPAAQVEISAGPFNELSEAEAQLNDFESRLSSILEAQGLLSLTLGYHPTARALDLELIPKRRYKFMNLYLSEVSKYGPYMMRGSASTQISIDYSSVEDCLRKLRLAFALVPLFSLICDNSPIFEGAPRTHELIRTKIWQECDPDRCGLIPGVMDPDFNLRSYAEYVLDTPAILIPCTNSEWCYSEKTFGEIYAETPMETSDVEHALSMLFNDVRLKTYIEIRPADAMPVPCVLAYAALIKGLFYSEESLSALETLFAHVDAAAIEDAKNALMQDGYCAFVYGRPAYTYVDLIHTLAHTALDEKDRAYLKPLSQLILKRSTLANKFDRN
ncbi:MAG: glutamate-cysteine ligase family protein [Raoultibacter sp.]